MTKLKKCNPCNIYTFKEQCFKCDKNTQDAHYTYKKLPIQISRRR